MRDGILTAFQMTERAHRGMLRRYTGEPYLVHVVAVAKTVGRVDESDAAVCAALLHDTLEDTDLTYQDIAATLGFHVADMVMELTTRPVPDEKRSGRMLRERMRLADATATVQTIKLADMLDNMPTIIEHDSKFAKVYMSEKAELLAVLTLGNEELRAAAQKTLDTYYGEKQENVGDARLRDLP